MRKSSRGADIANVRQAARADNDGRGGGVSELKRWPRLTDRQIDQLVYELYGLTDAEIQIVEEATRKKASGGC